MVDVGMEKVYPVSEKVYLGELQTPHSGYVTLCYFNHCHH
jgi:hypothetical protein